MAGAFDVQALLITSQGVGKILSGMAFRPKAVLVFGMHNNDDVVGRFFLSCIGGWADMPAQAQGGISGADTNSQTTPIAKASRQTTYAADAWWTDSTTLCDIKITGSTSDGFLFDVDTFTGTERWVIVVGIDCNQAELVNFNTKNSPAGNQDIATTFLGNLAFFGTGIVIGTGVSNSFANGLGIAISSISQMCISASNSASNDDLQACDFDTDHCMKLSWHNVANYNIADFTSFGASVNKVNWSKITGGGRGAWMLNLDIDNPELVEFTFPTGAAPQSLTVPTTNQAAGALLLWNGRAFGETQLVVGPIGTGAFHSIAAADQMAQFAVTDTTGGVTDCDSILATDSCIVELDAGQGAGADAAIIVKANVDQINPTDFRLAFPITSGVAGVKGAALVVGAGVGGGGTILPFINQNMA